MLGEECGKLLRRPYEGRVDDRWGEGVPFISGIDTPEIGSHAKCIKERKLALIAKGRLKELLAEKGLRVEWSGAVDKTPSRRPLVNIYQAHGEEVGKTLLKEGFAREWRPGQRNDWCIPES